MKRSHAKLTTTNPSSVARARRALRSVSHLDGQTDSNTGSKAGRKIEMQTFFRLRRLSNSLHLSDGPTFDGFTSMEPGTTNDRRMTTVAARWTDGWTDNLDLFIVATASRPLVCSLGTKRFCRRVTNSGQTGGLAAGSLRPAVAFLLLSLPLLRAAIKFSDS